MVRMRTVKAAVTYIRQQDSGSAISEWWVRTLIKQGKIKHHKAGNKILIDLDYFEEFLKNPPEEEQEDTGNHYGVLRKIY